MEQIGWDYRNARINGRNVFIFRDTSHLNEGVQDSLYREIRGKLQQRMFRTFFAEGAVGDKIPEYHSEAQLRKEVVGSKKRGACVAELLVCRCASEIKSGSLELYGIEKDELFKKHVVATKRAFDLASKRLARSISFLESMELDYLVGLSNRLSRRRSFWMAEIVARKMEEDGVDCAGMVFGDGHYQDVVAHLKRRNVGYVSFYPGCVEDGVEECLDYGLNL